MVTKKDKVPSKKTKSVLPASTAPLSSVKLHPPKELQSNNEARESSAEEKRNGGFPVVGIGASAGGLEAFEQFFRHVSPSSGMAFVLVPHLDPTHDSMLTEILQRSTTMPVVEAQDQVDVQPNTVYIIPPNREMSIFHSKLQLSVPEQPRGQRMPIDAFLRSLAEDQAESAIGIILSGTGTDGTLGLRAILGSGGISLVQEPASAKYDGMPHSAIGAGFATHILSPEKMGPVLDNAIRHLDSPQRRVTAAETSPAPDMSRILMQLRAATGHDFSLYKKSTIGRRIERRMSQHDIQETEVYSRFLKEQPAEMQVLFKELLINVTSFFRDPGAFEELKQDILPRLFADKPDGYVFRVWVAGCASGEEAYSIAILLLELMEETKQEFKIQLYATDLDDDAIATARAGIYLPNIAADITPERLRRFFVKEETGYRVKKQVREMVVFAIQNVIKDPPFTKLDLLCCRNLMIYLGPELQNNLIPAFHYALKPNGVLFLSPSESTGNHTALFVPLSRKWKIYRAVHSAAPTRTMMASARMAWSAEKKDHLPVELQKKIREPNFSELVKPLLLKSYAPASVVTDLDGTILFVYGETGKYLRPAPGQPSFNVIDMAREELQQELQQAIQAAGEGRSTIGQELVIIILGDPYKISFSVRPLPDPEAGPGLLLVSFQDVLPEKAAPAKAGRSKKTGDPLTAARIAELERNLTYVKENLHATIEEQQASNEELKSTNEEMQSTNEELQSTNEELETSKEELQSVNEELITVNTELEAKIQQLAGMQNDMKNLLDNVNVGTIFLDTRLNIRRFTKEAVSAYRLVASDIGRPLNDIKPNIRNDDLLADAQAVLDSLVPREREVQTLNEAWYLARIQPYRTLENMIDGVVMTFTDISLRMSLDNARNLASIQTQGIVDTVREPLLVLNAELNVVSASRSFYREFQVSPEDTIGRPIFELGNRQWDIPDLRELLEKILPQNQKFNDFIVEHDFPTIGHHKMVLNARRIVDSGGNTQMILLAIGKIL